MPRVVDPTKIAHAAELYATGKTFREAAAEVGMDPESLRLILRRRGVIARPRAGRPAHNRHACPDVDDLTRRYVAGESEKGLASHYGVSRGVIKRWLEDAGVGRRGIAAANMLHLMTLTPEQRSAKAAAAHDAVRGKPLSDEHAAKIAASRERTQYGGRPSTGTEWLCEALTAAGIEHAREKAVGRYNLDITLSTYPVAVEILGGNWHTSKPTHAVRTPYILNEGWHIVFVWNTKRCKIGPAALDYIVAFAEQTRLNPPAVSQYRVIRGDGQLGASGGADDDDFPLVPPSVPRVYGPRGHYRPRK